MQHRSILLCAGLALLSSACVAKSLSPVGGSVAVVSEAPEGCTQLGELVGLSHGGMRGDMSSPHDLEIGAQNDLRNREARIGADTVQVLARDGVVTHGFAGHARPSQVRHTGIAWRCGR